MHNPLISVIVPVYKVEPYLRKCVDSILAQTYTNIEVILIDDGSPDGCPALCDAYAQKDPRVIVIHQPNAGVSAARNAGLELAKGEYIGFVDSDDWIEPDMYETLYGLITKTGSRISIVGYYEDLDTAGSIGEKTGEYTVLGREDAIYEMLLGHSFQGHMPTKLIARSVFKENRFPAGISVYEDLELSVRLFKSVDSVVYTPDCYYHYLQREESSLHRLGEEHLTGLEAYELIYGEIKDCAPKSVGLLELIVIQRSISLAYALARSQRLTAVNYERINGHICAHLNRTVWSELADTYKRWLILFRCGRIPFIVARRVHHMLVER